MSLLSFKWMFNRQLRPEAHNRASVFPQLAFFHVFISGFAEGKVTVLDEYGQEIFRTEVRTRACIPLHAFPKGNYLVMLDDHNGTSYHAFQKIV